MLEYYVIYEKSTFTITLQLKLNHCNPYILATRLLTLTAGSFTSSFGSVPSLSLLLLSFQDVVKCILAPFIIYKPEKFNMCIGFAK